VRSTWNPTREELIAYGRGHLYYEVERSAAIPFLIAARGAAPSGRARIEHDSLLESFLVHVRLLDDFLGDPGQAQPTRRNDSDDVFARHWLPTWTPRRFMSEDERDRANAQIAHLTGRRIMGYGWSVPDLARRCCESFESFAAAVERTGDTGLVGSLVPARDEAKRFLSALTRATGHGVATSL
jgi:hypothetical protein